MSQQNKNKSTIQKGNNLHRQGVKTMPKKMQPATPTKKGNRYIILFLFIWTLVLYGNTMLNKYSVDDNYVAGPKNELVKKGFGAIPEILRTNYINEKGNIGSQIGEYRPIVKITFAIEYGLWGEKPGVSHSLNLLLYFWISVVLFFLLKRILKNYNLLFPFLITILFMAHPVHTEVVASLKNRDEMLAFLCGLYALKFFLDYAENKKILPFILGALMFFIGYLCKSSITPFLMVYPLVLYFFTDTKPRVLVVMTVSVIVAGALAYFIPRLFLPHGIRVNSYIENPLYFEKSFWVKTGTAMTSLLFYIRLLVFPHPLRYYYGFDMIPITNWFSIWFVLSLILHAGMLIYAIMKFREKHILSFAILLYLVFVAMYSNLVVPAVGIVAERFLFAASLGFCIALVYGIFRVTKTDPKNLTIEFSERAKIIVIIFLLLVPATARTISRNRDWRNIRDLYTSDIKHLDKSVKANIEYGEYLMSTVYNDPNFQQHGNVNQYKADVITKSFKKALAMYPKDYQTLNDLGTVYLNFMGMPDSAKIFLKRALNLNDTLKPAWVNMALCYIKTNKPDSAMACYKKIHQLYPDELNAVFKIADLYFEKGEFDTAVKMNEEVMKTHPDLHIPYFNIGYYNIMRGDTFTAVRYWEKSFEKKPSYEVCVNLYNMYRLKGDMEKANFYYSTAMEISKQMKNNRQP